YEPDFVGGAFVAAGDVLGIGVAAVVTGPGSGSPPLVRVFDRDGNPVGPGFLAYDPAFRGGVRVAVCDVDGDGQAEIVTGAGPGGGPHIRVFRLDASGAVTGEVASFLAYDSGFTGGVWVACGDVDGTGPADLVVAAGAGGGPHVRVFSLASGEPREVVSFFPFDPRLLPPVRV